MNTQTAVAEKPAPLINRLAGIIGIDRDQYIKTVKASCFPKAEATNEQLMHFLTVAETYDLNPFTKEIYAFPSNGGIQPIVPIDGWLKIINNHAQYDGMDTVEAFDDEKNLVSVTCSIYRKDRKRPQVITEYYSECYRNTDPWKNGPVRMLRHKATIQCARYAFSLTGIIDPDEAERFHEAGVIDMGNAYTGEVNEDNPCLAKDALQTITEAIGSDESLLGLILTISRADNLASIKQTDFGTVMDKITQYKGKMLQ